MKTSIKEMKLLSTLIAVTLMLSVTPMAFADPAPSVVTIPDPVTTGTTQVKLQLTGAASHTDMRVRVFEQNVAPANPSTGTLPNCNLASHPDGNAASDLAWTLVEKDTNTPLEIDLPNLAMIRIPFGGAGEFTTASMTVAGSPTYSATDAEWRELNAAVFNSDAVSQTVMDFHYYHICGFDASPNLQFNVNQPFEIVAPVAGTILPIDTTALMIAGIGSIGMWMLPVLGSAGLAVYAIRKKLA